MTETGKDNLVADWQEVTTLWDDLQARLADAEAHLLAPDLNQADKERYRAVASELAEQLTLAKQKIDAIVREARQGRVGRTGDFVAAELGPNMISDSANLPADTPGVSSRR